MDACAITDIAVVGTKPFDVTHILAPHEVINSTRRREATVKDATGVEGTTVASHMFTIELKPREHHAGCHGRIRGQIR
jgi:hypothetical protein